MAQRTVPDLFWAKVDTSAGPDRCWPFLGFINSGGYGRFWVRRVPVQAHRFAYEMTVGGIPQGLQLDHLCRNRACVNPAHLEPVTQRENILRGEAPPALAARKTHCPKGHPYSPENTYIVPKTGQRQCSTCRNRPLREVLGDYDARTEAG